MVCERHGIAAGPDGRCTLCRREGKIHEQASVRHADRRFHRGLHVLVGVVACVATYALLMALFDTRRPPAGRSPAGVLPARDAAAARVPSMGW
jgi:hypothetical protein